MRVCVSAQLLSCVWLFGIPWTIACQAPLSMGFSRREYWIMLPFPPPGDLPDSGTEPVSPVSPALAGRSFTTKPLVYLTLKFEHSIFYQSTLGIDLAWQGSRKARRKHRRSCMIHLARRWTKRPDTCSWCTRFTNRKETPQKASPLLESSEFELPFAFLGKGFPGGS